MKTSFELSLSGRDWWKPFIPFWIVYLAYVTENLAFSARSHMATINPGGFVLLKVVAIFIFVATWAIFTIFALRIMIPKFKAGERSFAFRGRTGKFLGILLLGTFLSIITLGICLGWFLRKAVSYLASETGIDGEAPRFLGKAGKFVAYWFLALLLPVIVVVAADILAFGTRPGATGHSGIASFTLGIFTFLVLIPFMYLTYRWYVDFSWKDLNLHWNTEFWPACGYILGQCLLTLITVGIYWPAAALRLYAYFVGRTVFERSGQRIGRLGFEGKIGKGFGLIWGQGLLCLITVGIYIPWGYSKVLRWIAGNSYYERLEEY